MKHKSAAWYRFTNKDDGRVEIFIYDVIVNYQFDEDEVTAKGFIDDLKAAGKKTPIDLHINSPGGNVFAGLAIHNAVKRHQGEVVVYIDGLAASIASVVAMAGNTIIMPDNALLMIHNPYGLAMGSAADLRKAAESLDKAKSGLMSAYKGKSGLEDETISSMMDEESWMTAAEALDLGFADQVEEALPMAALADVAAFDLSRYYNIPAGIKNTLNDNHIKQECIMDLKTLKAEHPELVTDIETAAIEGMVAADTVQTAVKEETSSLLDLHAAAFGPDAAEKFAKLVQSGMDADQMKAASELFGEQEKSAGGDGEEVKTQILAELKKKSPDELQNLLAKHGGQAGDNAGGDGTDGADFEALVETAMKDDGLSRGQAIAAMARKNPQVHAAWLEQFKQPEK